MIDSLTSSGDTGAEMPAVNQQDGGGGSERAGELSLSLVGNHRRHADFNPDLTFLFKHQNVCARERGPCVRGSVHGRTVGGGVCCLLMSNAPNGGPPRALKMLRGSRRASARTQM